MNLMTQRSCFFFMLIKETALLKGYKMKNSDFTTDEFALCSEIYVKAHENMDPPLPSLS